MAPWLSLCVDVARRLLVGLLAVCLALSSVETLWGEEPASELAGSAAAADVPHPAQEQEQEPEEDCPCLCDCACVNAQRVVPPVVDLVPGFDLFFVPSAPPAEPAPPPSADPEPHPRPPSA